MVSSPAVAQDEDVSEASFDEPIEEIVTTGSRIKRTEFSSPAPVQILNMEVATLGGLVDVTDILQESTVAANAPQWNNQWTGYVVTGGSGTNSVDLRGLGDGKTLVLLNGRRLNPAGTRGTVSQVDLNTIPTSIIQRVEILKDGASSVYGSDAVAGVVNIITKKNADGISGSASTNVPFDGGGEVSTADLTIGISNDSSSFMFGIDYLERKQLSHGDRDWSQCKVEMYRDPDTGEDLSMVDPTTGELKCWDSPANDYVVTFSGYGRNIWDPVGGSTDSGDINNWRVGSLAERKFDHPLQDEADSISPVKRLSLFSFGNWELDALGSNTEAYYEFMYNNRRSKQNSGPRQLGLRINDSPFSPFWSGGEPGVGFSFDIPLLLPYMQTGEQEVNWMRTVAGMTGDLSDNWSWDFAVGYGRSNGSYSSPQMLVDRIYNSLTLLEVAPGQYDCAINYDYDASDNFDRGECVPFNPYEIIASGQNSPGLFPQDLLTYITSVETGQTYYDQRSAQAYITGQLFEMPAGSVGAVFGAEYRRESIKDTPSSGAINGNLWGFTSSGITQGTDYVREVFTEIEIPLLAGMPGFEELVFSAAARWSDYDTAGDDTTYKVGLNWQIIDAVRLRSSFGTSFRAPSLYENFLGGQTAFTSASDPCEDFGTEHSPGEPIYENCLADTGDVNFPGYSSTPRIITFGNAGRLKPETSESLSVGLVFQFESIDLSIAIDYYDFEIKDEIDRYGASSILNQCYRLPTDQFRQPGTLCDFITPRDPVTGSIAEINDSYFNINEKNQDGIDLTVRYGFEVAGIDFTADLRSSTVLNYTQDLFGGNVDDFNGTIGYAESNAQFDLRADLQDWTMYYGLRWIEGQSDYDWYGYDPATSIYVLSTDDVYYHDLSARYNGDGWSAMVGVSNVADELPPMVSDWDTAWAGNAAYNTGYDMLGRSYFVNISKGF
jgi:outer membrane receptor protein involved in Fe transport